jgi:Fe-S cluster assembly iron-binding protein IscA
MKPDISLTPEAESRLAEELHDKVLRISFTTGCGGSGYRLASADEPSEEDVVLEVGPVKVALDEMSARKLDGAVIRYDEAEDGYTIDHPDAVAAVWCG